MPIGVHPVIWLVREVAKNFVTYQKTSMALPHSPVWVLENACLNGLGSYGQYSQSTGATAVNVLCEVKRHGFVEYQCAPCERNGQTHSLNSVNSACIRFIWCRNSSPK
ncbi:hypothetical protein ACTXT7_017065 [Hymenolepis weldensis]